MAGHQSKVIVTKLVTYPTFEGPDVCQLYRTGVFAGFMMIANSLPHSDVCALGTAIMVGLFVPTPVLPSKTLLATYAAVGSTVQACRVSSSGFSAFSTLRRFAQSWAGVG